MAALAAVADEGASDDEGASSDGDGGKSTGGGRWVLGETIRVVKKTKLPWREACPPNHHDDKVDSDQ